MRSSPYQIALTPRQEEVLEELVTSKKIERRYYQRAHIILGASIGKDNTALAKEVSLDRGTVRGWRVKWVNHQEKLEALEEEKDNKKYYEGILDILSDELRPGAPCEFTAEQVCQIIAVGCEAPENSGYPVSHWSYPLLREEVIKRGIVVSISVTQVGRFLKSSGSQTT